MSANLRRLIPTADANDRVDVQETEFSTDVVGRYVCSTWEEAVNNGGVEFDVVVIGAGMFGASCAEKIYRDSNLRVLVLEAGSLLVTEHVQNLTRIGLKVPGAVTVETDADDPGTRDRVWGNAWRSAVAFPGMAYCVGGRSLFWGGWAPRLTDDDLDRWPAELGHYLRNAYVAAERETGVSETTDYITGPLLTELMAKFSAARSSVPFLDAIEEAPLAVQASSPGSGLFSFDKWSSAPVLIDAIRDAATQPDWQRRLFLVPRAQVTRLHAANGVVTAIEVRVKGEPKLLNIAPTCAVVLANGTIESTRLALESFPTPLMGRNLMAHTRSNTVVRIRRSAFTAMLPQALQAAALLVRGSTPKGRFHLQVTAAAVTGHDSESNMWRMIPDIDLFDHTLGGQTADWIVITLRGVGEMTGSRDPGFQKITGSAPSWMDLSDQVDEYGMRRAWVNIVPNPDDLVLWDAMDAAALTLAGKLAGNIPANIQYFHGGMWNDSAPAIGAGRDGVGTTHHEAGTLWAGSDPATSVTDLDGRFHHIENAYVAGPALFPVLGSANPALVGIAMARRTAQSIVRTSLDIEPDFAALGNGGLSLWQMAGVGRFMELGAGIIESVGGPGILWNTKEPFDDFILRCDFRLSSGADNSGIFLRIPALGVSDPTNDWKRAISHGYEIQIDNSGFNPSNLGYGDPLHLTGAIDGVAPAMGPMPSPGVWHAIEIEALGMQIRVRIDGRMVSHLEDASRSARGFIGLQNHRDGSAVQFRRIRVKKLAPVPVVRPARPVIAARETRPAVAAPRRSTRR